MSRGVRDPDYRHLPGTLHKCVECATLTAAGWDPVNGYRCPRHAPKIPTELVIQVTGE